MNTCHYFVWLSSSLLEVYLILQCHLNFGSLFTATIPPQWFCWSQVCLRNVTLQSSWPWFALTSYNISLGSHSIPNVDVPTFKSSALSSLLHPSTRNSGCSLGIFIYIQQDISEAPRAIWVLVLSVTVFCAQKGQWLNSAAAGKEGLYMIISVSPLWGNMAEMYFLSLLRSMCHLIA